MGWLDKLVKPAIRQGDQMEYVDPEQVGVALARAAAETAQPSVADVQGDISEPYLSQGETMGPGPMATPQPDTPEMVQPPDQTTTSYETPQSKQPSIVKPSFEKASTDANGMPAGNTPGLTRLGKLFQILGMAAKGGLAGRAASERAVAESGGHRGGGFGTGFEAGLTEAPREAAMNQQVERGAMENETARANLAALPWMRAMQQRKAATDLEKEQAEASKAPFVTPSGGGVFDARTGKFVKGAGPTQKEGNTDQQTFDWLTSNPDPELGRALYPNEAYARMAQMKQDVKPDNAAKLKQDFMDSINTVAGEGLITPASMSSLPGMTAAIQKSRTLTPQKKTAALAYLASTSTPASQGSMANLRIEGLGATRGPGMVYDTKSGTLGPVTWEEINRASKEEPGRYVAGNVLQTIGPNGELGYSPAGVAVNDGSTPAASGAKVMAQQAQFSEMKTAAQKTREAINNLDRSFTAPQIAKLTMAMRETDPSILHQEIDSFFGSQKLTPAQQDFVTWIAQLNERAMSLRGVAGMGQGSDQLRAAIQNTLPSAKSGDKGLMLKQLGAFENQVNLLEKGIPKLKGQQGQQAQSAPKQAKTYEGIRFTPLQ